MNNKKERVRSVLNDGLVSLRHRYEIPSNDLLQALFCLAGDVDRYLQHMNLSGQQVVGNAAHELDNMKHRVAELKVLLKEQNL